MQIVAHGQTDVGKKRTHNEDYVLVREEPHLFIVCDGMGGHAGGEVASELAARTVLDAVMAQRDLFTRATDRPEDRERIAAVVRKAVEDASHTVFARATSEHGKAGMGTTLTMLLVVGARGVMAHVGDSRLFMVRDGKLHQLSEDHSYVAEMVKRGMLTPERAKDGPYSNVITRAVGIQASVQVDLLPFDVLAGDTYLLCSDGLHRYFEDESELVRLLSNDNVETLPAQLIALANERGGKDNITAVVVRAERDAEHADVDDARSTEVNLRLDTLRYVSLFRHLTMKELVRVLDCFRVVRCTRKEKIIAEGEGGRSLYVLLEGELVVTRGGKDIATLHPGEHFGEMSLLNSRPRSATVRSKGDSRLLLMDQQAFEELIKVDPVLGVKFLWTFAQVLSLRLDNANEEITEPPPFD